MGPSLAPERDDSLGPLANRFHCDENHDISLSSFPSLASCLPAETMLLVSPFAGKANALQPLAGPIQLEWAVSSIESINE